MTAIQERTGTTTYIDERVRIERSPADVLAFVLDVSNEPLWMTGVKSSEWLDGEIRVGSRCRTVSEFLDTEVVLTAEVTHLDDARVTFKITDGPMEMESSWTVEAEGQGAILACEAQKSIINNSFKETGLADTEITESYSAQLRGDMERLKNILEG